MNTAQPPVLRNARRIASAAWAFGVVGALGSTVFCITEPARAFHGYLVAFAFICSLVLGCMAFAMIAHAANATWPVAARRLAEAVAAGMPWLALSFVPIALGARYLYPWAAPESYAEPIRSVLDHRRAVMNLPAFSARALIALCIWSLWAVRLRHHSFAMERAGSAELGAQRLRRLSYAGLPLIGTTAGFAGYDWFMSVSPTFTSSMFAALWLAMCLLAGVASVVTLAAAFCPDSLTSSHVHALGRLLFAYLFFLAYTAFFQFLLVWIANKPLEAEWYLARMHGVAAWSGWFLVFGALFVPFLLLLNYDLKRRLRSVALIGVWCLIGLYVHIHWLIVPSSGDPRYRLCDLAALLAVGGLTLGMCAWQQRDRALVAFADPRYAAALRYESR